MNKARILELASHLLMPEIALRFGMENFFSVNYNHKKPSEIIHDCGTTACLAGWAVSIWEPEMTLLSGHFMSVEEARKFNPRAVELSAVGSTAADILNLPTYIAASLFIGGAWQREQNDWMESDPIHAARVLVNLVKTGRVVWELPQDNNIFKIHEEIAELRAALPETVQA